MSTHFPKRLVEARKALGWTQRQLGEAIGVRGQTVSDWERGLVESPEAPILAAAADVLGVTVEWLLGASEQAKGADVVKLPPPGLREFLETEEARELVVTDAEREVLADYGRAMVARGYRPTLQLYMASLAQLRIAPREATKR